jgi:hypothetical protein
MGQDSLWEQMALNFIVKNQFTILGRLAYMPPYVLPDHTLMAKMVEPPLLMVAAATTVRDHKVPWMSGFQKALLKGYRNLFGKAA